MQNARGPPPSRRPRSLHPALQMRDGGIRMALDDQVNQRERALNLCRELAIPENEQVIRVIVYALEKWTKPQESGNVLNKLIEQQRLEFVRLREVFAAIVRWCDGQNPAGECLDRIEELATAERAKDWSHERWRKLDADLRESTSRENSVPSHGAAEIGAGAKNTAGGATSHTNTDAPKN